MYLAQYGSVSLSDVAKTKGPLMGCLLCKLGADCVYALRYTSTRKEPLDTVGNLSSVSSATLMK